jgi:integrase
VSSYRKDPKTGIYIADFRDIGGGRPSLRTKNERVAAKSFRLLELESCERRLDPVITEQILTLAMKEKLRKSKAKGRDVKVTETTGKIHCRNLERHLAGIDFNDPATNLERVGEFYYDERSKEITSKGTPTMPHTIRKELGTLAQGLKKAKRYEIWEGEPGDVIPDALRSADIYKPRTRWLPDDEYNDHRGVAPPPRQYLMDLGVENGPDLGELMKVRRDTGVDLSTARGPLGAYYIPGTKTGARARWIPLSRAARVAVDWFLENGKDPDYLIRPKVNSANFGRDVRKWCKKNGRQPFIFKDLRRTFVSRCAQLGIPEFHVIKMVGHKDSKMIRQVYAQLCPGTYEAAVMRLDEVPYIRRDNVIDIGKRRENVGKQKDVKC